MLTKKQIELLRKYHKSNPVAAWCTDHYKTVSLAELLYNFSIINMGATDYINHVKYVMSNYSPKCCNIILTGVHLFKYTDIDHIAIDWDNIIKEFPSIESCDIEEIVKFI